MERTPRIRRGKGFGRFTQQKSTRQTLRHQKTSEQQNHSVWFCKHRKPERKNSKNLCRSSANDLEQSNNGRY